MTSKAILKEFRFVVTTDTWERCGQLHFGAGVVLPGEAGFLRRDSSAWFLNRRVETQKAAAGDLPGGGC